MEEYARIRRMYFLEGKSQRQLAHETQISRPTIRKMLEEGSPPGYRRSEPKPRPKLGPYLSVIDGILKSDKEMPKKQRHTAQRIFERLKAEWGYAGGYTQVREYVKEALERRKEAYVPLAFSPGTAQVDWGEATVWLDGEVAKGWIFVMSLPWSNARFVAAFPQGTAEFFYRGHELAFQAFGGIPKAILYDNLKTAVVQVGKGKQRTLNATFRRFAEHYLFEPRFCNVARGNEKGHVENGVAWARHNFFVPRPDVSGGWEPFNKDLAGAVISTYRYRCRGHLATIAERLSEEQAHLLPIPHQAPLLFQPLPAKVNSLSLVRFQSNDYSVPCRWAYHPVTVKASVDQVKVFYQDLCIAEHRRSYRQEQTVYEPWHYLPLIEKKPGALDDAAPLKALELSPCFTVLRRRLEVGQEYAEGTRGYISVLRLLEAHSLAELTRAVERALALNVFDAEAVKNLLLCPPDRIPGPLDLKGRPRLAAYHFAPPSLSGYRGLVEGGWQ